MVFVYGSLHKKCLVLWKERYFVLKVRRGREGQESRSRICFFFWGRMEYGGRAVGSVKSACQRERGYDLCNIYDDTDSSRCWLWLLGFTCARTRALGVLFANKVLTPPFRRVCANLGGQGRRKKKLFRRIGWHLMMETSRLVGRIIRVCQNKAIRLLRPLVPATRLPAFFFLFFFFRASEPKTLNLLLGGRLFLLFCCPRALDIPPRSK